MRIGVVGLGLIGGSLAKAFKAKTEHIVAGVDSDPAVIEAALADGAIDTEGGLELCDLVYCCLYPEAAAAYLLATRFKAGAVVTDMCGVKRWIMDRVSGPLRERGVLYVGSHPMAGREKSGYAASDARLFEGASYIMCRDEDTDEDAVRLLAEVAGQAGFKRITMCTPAEHDMVIAYTSQLAHVVSNSYVKNDLALEKGFSAGSFDDLTRVARLNPAMWAELFLDNGDFLCEHIDTLIANMCEMRAAIADGNKERLTALLREGSGIKEAMEKDGGKNPSVQPGGN